MKLEMYSKVLGIHNFILIKAVEYILSSFTNAILSNNQCVGFTAVENRYYLDFLEKF